MNRHLSVMEPFVPCRIIIYLNNIIENGRPQNDISMKMIGFSFWQQANFEGKYTKESSIGAYIPHTQHI